MSEDDFSPKVVAYRWVARITAVSIEMCVPGLLGYLLDRKIGVLGPFTVIGFGLGLGIGIWQLVRMGNASSEEESSVGSD